MGHIYSGRRFDKCLECGLTIAVLHPIIAVDGPVHQYCPGRCVVAVTLLDVARLAGASKSAVSATLNGSVSTSTRVSQETRERIYAAAAQLGYVPNPIAKSLATGKTGVLGLMLPFEDAFISQNPFCGTVMAGIMREVLAEKFNLMLYTATGGMSMDQAASQVDSRVDGLLLVIPPEDCEVFAKCAKRHIPYVSVLRKPEAGSFVVNSDDFAGGHLATNHLIQHGHRRIAHLMGNFGICTTEPRRNGYRAALQEAGIVGNPMWEIPSDFLRLPGYLATKVMLQQPSAERPTAIFACNDLCAAGAMQALAESGMRVPEDVAVVGYDDTLFCTVTQPPLTSVHMPIAEMGSLAARMLIAQVQRQEVAEPNLCLPVSLSIRHSCGASGLANGPGAMLPQ